MWVLSSYTKTPIMLDESFFICLYDAPKRRVMRGMVIIEKSVVMKVASVMSDGLRPNLRQNIVPKEATGIAMTTV